MSRRAQQLALLPEQEEQEQELQPTSKHGWDAVNQQYQEALKIINRFPDLAQAIADGKAASQELRQRDKIIAEQANTINLLKRKLEEAQQGTAIPQLEQENAELRARLTRVCAERLKGQV